MIYPIRAHLRFLVIREEVVGFAQTVLYCQWKTKRSLPPPTPQLLVKIFLTEKRQKLVYSLVEEGVEGRIVYFPKILFKYINSHFFVPKTEKLSFPPPLDQKTEQYFLVPGMMAHSALEERRLY